MANKSNPVNWFEIPANDLSRAQAFYEYILGVPLSATEMGPMKIVFFPMEQGASGTSGMIVKSATTSSARNAGTMVYFSVENIESVLRRVDEKGGKTLEPKHSIGEYGFVGIFHDTEGNRVGLHSMK